MTVDDVIRDVLRAKGFSTDDIAGLEAHGDRMDPIAAAGGKMEVTEREAAAIRRDMEAMSKLPPETIFRMLAAFQTRARNESVVN